MTAQTTTVNKAAFEQGDRPQGSNYSDLIDSYINVVDTTAQSMASDLTVPNLTVNTTLQTTHVTAQTVAASALTCPIIHGTYVSAQTVYASLADFNVASANTVNFGRLLSTNGLAQIRAQGTAQFTTLNSVISAVVTILTTVQTSGMFSQLGGVVGAASGQFKACWLMRINVNGSAFAIPLLRGSTFF